MPIDAATARRAGGLLWPLARPILAILIALLVGAGLGALLGERPLGAYVGGNELVVCLMLNPVALLLTGWVSARVLKAPGPTNKLPDILPSAVLPGLSAYSQLNDGIFIGILLVVAVWLFNRFTLRGF